MKYWLVKQEPSAWGWPEFVAEGQSEWDGIRNYQARNYLRAMKRGDLALFYHSVTGKEVVGVAEVVREAYPDPTAKQGDWSAVDLKPVTPLARTVTLETIKQDRQLEDLPLIRHTRVSVMPVTAKHFRRILKLGATTL